jgi:hypothetical protein
VELFEQIRREYEFGIGTIVGVATKLGVHRRMVREAIGSVRREGRPNHTAELGQFRIPKSQTWAGLNFNTRVLLGDVLGSRVLDRKSRSLLLSASEPE